MTLDAVGKACGGKSPQAIHAWESGRSRPSAIDMSTIAALTGVSLGWLISGADEPVSSHDGTDKGSQIAGRIVPSIAWIDVQKHVESKGQASGVAFARSHFSCGPRSFRTSVEDRSNEPEILPGDSIIVDPDVAPCPGDYVLAETADGGLILRRYRLKSDGVELLPVNPDWPAVKLTGEADGTIVGTVTEHCRPRRV